jgi:hypothetical protein
MVGKLRKLPETSDRDLRNRPTSATRQLELPSRKRTTRNTLAATGSEQRHRTVQDLAHRVIDDKRS